MLGRIEKLWEKLGSCKPDECRKVRDWMRAGMRRQGWSTLLVALLTGWSGIWLVLWIAAAAALAGAVAGGEAAMMSPGLAGSMLGESATVLGIIVGAAAGGVAGGCTAFWGLFLASPGTLAASMAGGAVLSLLILFYLMAAEPWIMRMHGYRRLSQRENTRLMPLAAAVAQDMGISNLPTFLMDDSGARSAQTHLRHIVVGKLLADELTDEALSGIMAHELHHWRSGDTIGLSCVYASALPAILLYDIGAVMTKSRHGVLAAAGWVLLWPPMVLMRLVIEPMLAHRSRSWTEYDCDAAAKKIGRGRGLAEALAYLGDFESAEKGWHKVLVRTHPPVELRLELLEETQADLQHAA